MQVIYVDVLFLMNFSADFMVLYLTKSLLRREATRRRLLLSALLGALYAVLATVFLQAWQLTVTSAIGVLALMVLFTFGYGGIRRFVRAMLVCGLLSCLLGGVVTVLWSLLRRFFGLHEVAADTGGKLIAFLILCGVGYLLVTIANRLSGVGRETSVNAVITVGSARRSLVLLADNACFLREPLSGKPVVILSAKSAEGLLPSALVAAKEGEIPTLATEERRRYYAIPYHTVGGKMLMHGYRPDSVEITCRGKKKRVSALIGVGDASVTQYRGCDGIVPSGILDLG